MKIEDKIKNFFEKAQALPETTKKIILFSIVAVFAIVMGYFWVRGVVDSIPKISQGAQSIKLPQIDTSTMPSLDIQKIKSPK